MNALVYVDIDQGIHKVKVKIALNEKQKKTMCVFFFNKYSKFWSILPDKKVDLKPFFSEEWQPISKVYLINYGVINYTYLQDSYILYNI